MKKENGIKIVRKFIKNLPGNVLKLIKMKLKTKCPNIHFLHSHQLFGSEKSEKYHLKNLFMLSKVKTMLIFSMIQIIQNKISKNILPAETISAVFYLNVFKLLVSRIHRIRPEYDEYFV